MFDQTSLSGGALLQCEAGICLLSGCINKTEDFHSYLAQGIKSKQGADAGVTSAEIDHGWTLSFPDIHSLTPL